MPTGRTDFDVITGRLQNQVFFQKVYCTPQTIVFADYLTLQTIILIQFVVLQYSLWTPWK